MNDSSVWVRSFGAIAAPRTGAAASSRALDADASGTVGGLNRMHSVFRAAQGVFVPDPTVLSRVGPGAPCAVEAVWGGHLQYCHVQTPSQSKVC